MEAIAINRSTLYQVFPSLVGSIWQRVEFAEAIFEYIRLESANIKWIRIILEQPNRYIRFQYIENRPLHKELHCNGCTEDYYKH